MPKERNVISKGFIIPCPSRKLHTCNKGHAINIQRPTIGLHIYGHTHFISHQRKSDLKNTRKGAVFVAVTFRIYFLAKKDIPNIKDKT